MRVFPTASVAAKLALALLSLTALALAPLSAEADSGPPRPIFSLSGIGGQALNGITQIACQGGAADDTAAVVAAFATAALGKKTIQLPPSTCNVCPAVAGAAVTLTTGGWSVYGEGATSAIKLTCDGEFLRNDISGGVLISNDTFIGFRVFSSLGDGNQTHTAAIRTYCNLPGDDSCGGDNTVVYRDLYFGGIYYGIKYDDPSHTIWQGIKQLANYSNNFFYGIHSSAVNGVFPYDVVHFDAGPGPQAVFIGGTYAASHASLAIGDGVSGVGDLIAHGIEFVGGQYGVYILGPTDPARYAYNINLTGNQYDGLSVNTVYMSNISGCYVDGNNATTSVPYALINTSCQSFQDQFAYYSRNGTQTITFTNGATSSRTVFYINRVPQASVTAFDAVEVKVFMSGLVGTIGDVELIGDYIIEFSNATGVTSRAASETTYGPGAAYLSMSRTNSSPDHVQFIATMTGLPSNGNIKAQVQVIGSVGRFSLTAP